MLAAVIVSGTDEAELEARLDSLEARVRERLGIKPGSAVEFEVNE